MSKHLKADGTQAQNGDIPVVTPSNMGKGVKWDAGTNKYNVDVGTGTGLEIKEDGTVGLALSKDAGNLIEQRKDGLYYGVTAPANLRNLYVDAVNGVDQNPDNVQGAGTRENPLRTLKYAAWIAKEGSIRTIYLKEKQEHVVDVDYPVQFKAGTTTVTLYGDDWDAFLESRPNSDGWASAIAFRELGKQPTIKFTGVYKTLYPRAEATNAVNIFYTRGITISDGATVYMTYISLGDDLGFQYNLDPTDLQSDRAMEPLVSDGRIFLAGTGTLILSGCSVSSTGTPTTNLNVTSSSIRERLGLDLLGNGLRKTNLITYDQNSNGGVNITGLKGFETYPNLLVGTRSLGGYSWRGTPFFTINPTDTAAKKEVLSKHSHSFSKENRGGINFVKAPRVNVSEDLFFA